MNIVQVSKNARKNLYLIPERIEVFAQLYLIPEYSIRIHWGSCSARLFLYVFAVGDREVRNHSWFV